MTKHWFGQYQYKKNEMPEREKKKANRNISNPDNQSRHNISQKSAQNISKETEKKIRREAKQDSKYT